MTTKLKREAIEAVKAWCKKQKIQLTAAPRHIHPRSYVVGRTAPGCLIVTECWADSESQMREFNKANPLRSIHTFDASLKAGDWCITAYVSTPRSSESVAIPLKENT